MQLVLVIDDDPLMLAAVRRVLGDLPARVVCARSAEEALEIIAAQPPTVIVSDHGLPGVSGLDLLAQVRSRWPGVRSLLHTGDPEAQARAVELRFAAVAKGAATPALRGVVMSLLAGAS